jgi:DNA-binding SARP family transcriptional activator
VAPSLRLLSGFVLACDEDVVPLPLSAQRVVVFLALQERPLLRDYVAGTLWLETPEQRAGANLRSALWRLNQPGHSLVEIAGSSLALAPSVRVDLRERSAQAHRLLDGAPDWTEADLDKTPFCFDLLPGWYDDWLLIERERFHQLRLGMLERICDRQVESGRYTRALEAGLAAVAGEPLRESAHRSLVRAHLAEGNRAEAIRQYELYRRLLREQLGLAPSPQIVDLLRR